MNLTDLKLFASKCMHHSDRTQSFLRLSQDGTLLFLDGRWLPTNTMCENINRADNQWNDRERDQRQPPIQPQHDHECCDECDYRSKDIGETFVVDRLDRL